MQKYKLGKKAPINKDSLAFGDFVTLLPTVPLIDTAPSYTYGMDLNDKYGDCVVAAFDHARQTITGLLTGVPKTFTTEEIEALYKTQNPNFPAEDNGMDIQTFLEYLQANKYIVGFAKIDHNNEAQMKAAIYMGLSIMTGVQLQEAQEQQFPNTWDFVPGGKFIGGHGIPAIAYQANPDETTIVTWGKAIPATQAFIKNQMDEAWFILLQEHIDHPAFRTHWNLAAFSQAVSEITGGKIQIPIEARIPQNTVVITRTNDDGVETLGTLLAKRIDGTTFSCDTLELPWKENEVDVSCIPKGNYTCKVGTFHSEQRYELQNTSPRSGIFIHEGNYFKNTDGCILLGISPSDINADGQIDVTSSVVTITNFMKFFNNEEITLVIK